MNRLAGGLTEPDEINGEERYYEKNRISRNANAHSPANTRETVIVSFFVRRFIVPDKVLVSEMETMQGEKRQPRDSSSIVAGFAICAAWKFVAAVDTALYLRARRYSISESSRPAKISTTRC